MFAGVPTSPKDGSTQPDGTISTSSRYPVRTTTERLPRALEAAATGSVADF